MGIRHVPKPVLVLFLFGFLAGLVVMITSQWLVTHDTWNRAPDWIHDAALILCPMCILLIGLPFDGPPSTAFDQAVITSAVALANGVFFGGIGELIGFFQRTFQRWNGPAKTQWLSAIEWGLDGWYDVLKNIPTLDLCIQWMKPLRATAAAFYLEIEMADEMGDQDYYGGLAQDLLGKTGLMPTLNMGFGAALSGAPPISATPSLTSKLSLAANAKPPRGDYATVGYYPGPESNSILSHLFNPGHLGLSINGGPAYGLEPTPGIGVLPMIGHEPPHQLQTFSQLFDVVPGEVDMIPANRAVGDQVKFPVTHDQSQAMQQYLRSLAGPTLYNLPFKDCVTTVAGAMKSAHLNTPSTFTSFTPAQFVQALHAMYDKPAAPPN